MWHVIESKCTVPLALQLLSTILLASQAQKQKEGINSMKHILLEKIQIILCFNKDDIISTECVS